MIWKVYGHLIMARVSIRTRRQKEQKENDKSGIRTHAPYETRKLIAKLYDKVTLPWRLGPLGHLASTVE